MYSLFIFVAVGVSGVVTFTGEPVESYILRKPAMLPFLLVIVAGAAIEIPRCAIMIYNILINEGVALFVRGGKIVFISRYFTSIPISQIANVVPIKKKTVHVILSNGKRKKIYASFLTPSDSKIVAQKIEALVHGVDEG
jgi:hypothetical protein